MKDHKDWIERNRLGPIWEYKTRSGLKGYVISRLARNIIQKLWPNAPKTAYDVLGIWDYGITLPQFQRMVDSEPVGSEEDVLTVTNLVHWFAQHRLQYDEDEWERLIPRKLEF